MKHLLHGTRAALAARGGKSAMAGNDIKLADAARDEGRWQSAAQFYRRAALARPGRSEYWVQAGNCFKEAGAFEAAFDAYAARLAVVPDDGDCLLQLGHVLKVSGNFRAALRAYRKAGACGEPRAAAEIETLPSVDVAMARLCRLNASDDHGAAAAIVLRTLLVCDNLGVPDAESLRDASAALARWDENDLARSFGELAFLADSRPNAFARHARFMAISGLWGPVVGSTNTNDRLKVASSGARTRFGHLVRAAIAASDQAEMLGQRDTAPPAMPAWPLMKFTGQNADAHLSILAERIHAVHESFLSGGDEDASVAMDAVRALSGAVQADGVAVAIPASLSRTELRCCAVRVLSDCVRSWIRKVEGVYLNPLVPPRFLGAFRQLGSNPFLERLTQGASAEAVFHELEGLLSGLLEGAGPECHDRARALVLAVCAPDLSREVLDQFCRFLTRANAPRSCEVLFGMALAVAPKTEIAIVGRAQQLKSLGAPDLALQLLEQHLDEAEASLQALTEKALLAKIGGRFDMCVRLLETCYAKSPSDFLRAELVATLPEIEPIASILNRYAHDQDFLETARRRPLYRLALGRNAQDDAVSGLAMELAPEWRDATLLRHQEAFQILEMGRNKQRVPNGWRPSLRRIDCVRVMITSSVELCRLRVRLDGRTVGHTPGVPMEADDGPLYRRMFNCWIDLSKVEKGLHEIQLYAEEIGGGYRTVEDMVWVDPTPPDQDMLEKSVAFIPSLVEAEDDLEARIAQLPSVTLRADRPTFAGALDRILVVRADQLGDTVLSIPAIQALRRHFPQAELYGLFSPAQCDLMRSTGLFREVFSVSLPYDPSERRRLLRLGDQAALRDRLAPYEFDLAIDLSPGMHTRPLLRLVGARYTAGFQPGQFPWLSFGIDVMMRDPGNGQFAMKHSKVPATLVEALAIAVKSDTPRLDKVSIDPAFLRALGMEEGRRYAVLHAGARTASRKWPVAHYLEVARHLVREAGLFVVLLLDTAADLPETPTNLASTDFKILSGHLAFADFDGLISNCAVFVGNDTGPKHLAALRGAPVVSIHMGAVNGSEWGQEESGIVVTRRVPCYGCGIELEEECGKGLPCLRDIQPSEVAQAAISLVAG